MSIESRLLKLEKAISKMCWVCPLCKEINLVGPDHICDVVEEKQFKFTDWLKELFK